MQRMRSRHVIGASAWLLGALTATGGSMLAVSHLAHGLLGPGTQQLSPAAVRDALAAYEHPGAQSARATAARPAATTLTPASTGTLLASRAGTATASCQSGLAYLLYWTPSQGYQADDVFRGPAQQVSVVFEGGGPGVRMRVTCSGSMPVAHLSDLLVDSHSGWPNE